MLNLTYTDPDEGFGLTLEVIRQEGVQVESRNGPVLALLDPAMIQMNWSKKRRRLVLNPLRDVNSFFTHYETICMMAGRNDLESLTQFLPGFAQYSDDGRTVRGSAYGFRWIKHFGRNQLKVVLDNLRDNPDDRRAVVTMWDGNQDLRDARVSKDVPCNMQIVFSVKQRESELQLDMTVFNRSNDVVYGTFGSNIYHFSFLHEYMALCLGVAVGRYNQITNNLHLYLQNEVSEKCLETDLFSWKPPEFSQQSALEIFGVFTFEEADKFLLRPESTTNAYLKNVSLPLVMSHRLWKNAVPGINLCKQTRIEAALEVAQQIQDEELRFACVSWLERRKQKL